MNRTIYKWAKGLSSRNEVELYSPFLPAELRALAGEDPMLSWIDWAKVHGPPNSLGLQGLSKFSALMPPTEKTGVGARFRRSLAYRSHSWMHRFGFSGFKPGSKGPRLYHLPQPKLLPSSVPAGWKIAMNVYDTAPFIFRDTYTERSRHMLEQAIIRIKNRSGHLIVNSYDVRHSVICLFDFPPSCVHVVPLGADSSFENERGYIDLIHICCSSPYFIAINSGWQRRKNLWRTIDAFLAFKQHTGLPHRLIVTGVGSEKIVAQISGKKGKFAADIQGMGYVSGHHLDQLIRGATAGVYVSLYEGFGLPPLEFMARGVPVISSNCGAVNEVSAGHSISVDPFSQDQISNAFETIATDANVRRKLAEDGLSRASSYTWDKSVAALWNTYESILNV